MKTVADERLISVICDELGAELCRAMLEVVGCRDKTTHYIDVGSGDAIPESTLCGRRRAFHLVLTPRRGVNPVTCDVCRERAREKSLSR